MLDSDLTHQPTAAPAQASNAPIDIKEITDATGRKAFHEVCGSICIKMTPPLSRRFILSLASALIPNKNPLLKKCDHALYMAYQNGAPVGRISVIKNVDHLERATMMVLRILVFLSASTDQRCGRQHLSIKPPTGRMLTSLTKLAGPYNFSVNEECGLLIDGFDTPPYIMMPHGKPYYIGDV